MIATCSDSFVQAARAVIQGGYLPAAAELGDQEVAITAERIVLGASVEAWLLGAPCLPIHIASHRLDVLLCSSRHLGPAQSLNVEYHFGQGALGLGPVSSLQGLIRKAVHRTDLVVMAGLPAVLIPDALARSIYPIFQHAGMYWSTYALPERPALTEEAWRAAHRPATTEELEAGLGHVRISP